MSKILIEFDTKEKECGIFLDGVPIDDVYSISIYKSRYNDEDHAYIEISKVSDLGEGMTAYTRIMASDSENGKEAVDKGNAYVTADKTLIYSSSINP